MNMIGKPRVRYKSGKEILTHKAALIMATLLLLTACAGRNEAIQVTRQISLSAETAKASVKALKTAHESQIEAHKTTRNTLKAIIKEYTTLKRAATVEPLRTARDASYTRLNTSYLAAVTGVREDKATASLLLEQRIDTAMKPLENKVNALDELVRQAVARQALYPADKDVVLARKKADAHYLAAAAAYFQIKLDAVTQGIKELNSAEQAVLKRLDISRLKFKGDIDKKYTEVLEGLPSSEIVTIDLGPDPTLPAGYDTLVEYNTALKTSADQITRQYESSGFGKNSFFQQFLNSFGGGLIAGIIGGKEGAVSSEDLKAAAADVASPLVGNFKDSLSDIEQSARDSLNATKANATSQLVNKAAEALKPIFNQVKSKAEAINTSS